jgi:hypothetical protein
MKTILTSARVAALILCSLGMSAQAVNDFNSSRSNRQRGNLASPPASAGETRDFNTTRSNKEKGALTHVSGDPHVDQATASSAPSNERTVQPSPSGAAVPSGKTGHVTLMK